MRYSERTRHGCGFTVLRDEIGTCAELEGVFGLYALRVASELGDERLEGGHVRHAYLQGLGVYN